MKKIALIAAVLSFGILNAQKLNDKGLYVNTEGSDPMLFNGELFNGVIKQTQNGVTSEFNVKEGVVEGQAVYYYAASGKLMEMGAFTQGKKDKQWTRYNENGTVAATAFYSLGKKTGTWLVFDEKGQKRFEMNYSDGEKTGVWTSWNEDGALATTKDYNAK